VDGGHEVRALQVDPFQTCREGYATIAQKGAHGAIAEEDASLQGQKEGMVHRLRHALPQALPPCALAYMGTDRGRKKRSAARGRDVTAQPAPRMGRMAPQKG
jgi:hypothetical protein